MKENAPDIYIVGTQKSGTTTLYDWIAQHPEIYSHPLAKDYPYFSNDITYRDGSKLFLSFTNGNEDKHLVLGGEANAMYASLGPFRMSKMIPNAKLIVILRNPVERAYSAYCYAVERLMENRSLKQAFEEELDGLEYEKNDALQRDYLSHGHYSHQLKTLYQFFDKSNVKIVIFEELKNEPLMIIKDIFQFIGVSEDFLPNLEVKNKTMGGNRFSFFTKIVQVQPSSKIIRKLVRMTSTHSLRTRIRRQIVAFNRVSKPKPEFTDDVYQILSDYYKDEICEFHSILGRECWNKIE